MCDREHTYFILYTPHLDMVFVPSLILVSGEGWSSRSVGLFVSRAFAGIGLLDDQNSESSQCRRTSRGLPPRGVRHRLAVDCVLFLGLEFRLFGAQWVHEWRVEDVAFVDYVVLVLLDFDECFLGLG